MENIKKIELELTKKEIKILKQMRHEIESEICRRYIQVPGVNIREEQRKDKRIVLIDKIIS